MLYQMFIFASHFMRSLPQPLGKQVKFLGREVSRILLYRVLVSGLNDLIESHFYMVMYTSPRKHRMNIQPACLQGKTDRFHDSVHVDSEMNVTDDKIG